MTKSVLLVFFFTVCFLFSGNGWAFAKMSEEVQNVYRFVFRPGGELYEEGYRNNTYEWQRIAQETAAFSTASANSDYYFLVESFIESDGDTDDYLLNRAAFRASIIRSLLRQRLDIPYEKVVFYINRSGQASDVVQVRLINKPVPAGANRDIFFSFSSSRPDISGALSRYGQLPFYDLYYYNMEVADAFEPEEEIKEPAGELLAEVPVQSGQTSGEFTGPAGSVEPEVQPLSEVERLPEPAHAGVCSGAGLFNIGIKTNLLPWMGLVPVWAVDGKNASGYGTGALMYNGAVEYCFAQRYSAEFSFLYAYSSYDGRKDNLWGVSEFALEPRLWFSDNNRFGGFNVGFRASYGDFDIRDNKPQNYGKTGRFYSAGFTLGYTLPLYSTWLLVEGRLSVGYRNVYDGKVYRYSPAENKNYYEDAFAKKNWIVGASLNILFRCGFRK